MKNYSIWNEYKMARYPRLEKDIITDILIIGGGLTGLNTFYALKDMPQKILLVEKNKLGQGISSRSSAKITYLQEGIYQKISNFKKAQAYYEANIEAMQNYAKIIKKEKIDCNLEIVKSILKAYQKKEIKKIKKEEELLTKFGNPNKASSSKHFYTYEGIFSYVIHPLKYLDAIAKLSLTKKHQIYEDTGINKIKRKKDYYLCYTDKNIVIQAKIVIIASFYPNFLYPYFFPLKCSLERSFLVALKSPNAYLSSINIQKPIHSLRYYQDYVIHVGNTHNLSNYQNIFLEGEYVWSNYDIMTFDHLPLIGYLKKNLIIATGYNTWGLTGSMLASLVIKDLINHKKNKYQKLFNPKRWSIKKIIKYPYHILMYIKAYFKGNIKRCPHMGCPLIYNDLENTFDCPCHGSRFSYQGKYIIGPSKKNLK